MISIKCCKFYWGFIGLYIAEMMKKALFVIFVAIVTYATAARIARSPGGAGWQGSARGFTGYNDNGPSIVAARSSDDWDSSNFGRSLESSPSKWRSGLSRSSSESDTSGITSRSFDGNRGQNAYASRSLNGYSGQNDISGFGRSGFGGYSGRSAGYSGSAGGWGSSDYSDASGRSVSWQASW